MQLFKRALPRGSFIQSEFFLHNPADCFATASKKSFDIDAPKPFLDTRGQPRSRCLRLDLNVAFLGQLNNPAYRARVHFYAG